MMKKIIIIVSMIVIAGCVYKPYREIDEAKVAVEEARKAEADIYAPEEFNNAVDFLNKALDEMKREDYIAAKASALSAKNFAEMALKKAEEEKNKRKGRGEGVKEVPVSPISQQPPEEVEKTGEVALGGEKEDVILLERVHFAFDDYSLSDEAKEIIKKNYRWLQEHPSVKVIIEGHCDERGTEEYNLALGQKRAESVKKFLIELGMDPSRIETVSYGESVPLDPGHNEDAWAKNRRAEFVVKK